MNPRRQDPCKGSPQPAAAPEICFAAHPGIEPGSFLINSQAPTPCLLVRIETDFLPLMGAPGLEPGPGTLKGCCAAFTPCSRCSSIFAARRKAFRLLPWAPAFLNLATATSELRGADLFRSMVVPRVELHRAGDSLESPAMPGAAGRVRTCDACAFNAALYQAELQRQVWSGVRDSNSFGQLGRLEHSPYANPALWLW